MTQTKDIGRIDALKSSEFFPASPSRSCFKIRTVRTDQIEFLKYFHNKIHRQIGHIKFGSSDLTLSRLFVKKDIILVWGPIFWPNFKNLRGAVYLGCTVFWRASRVGGCTLWCQVSILNRKGTLT